MSRVVIENLDGLAPYRSLRGIDLAQIQNVTLHDAATCDTLVLDDAPIVVRLAVFLALGLPQKHDAESSRANLHVGMGRSSLQPISAVFAEILPADIKYLRPSDQPKLALEAGKSAKTG